MAAIIIALPLAAVVPQFGLWMGYAAAPMPHTVIVGLLLAVETEAILLSGNVRIIIPPTLEVPDLPIGCSVTVLVDKHPGKDPILVSIKRSSIAFGF
jgi:hypothetical protein